MRVSVILSPFCDELEHLLQLVFNVSVLEYSATILRTPYDVIITYPCCMVEMIESSIHIRILYVLSC